MDGTYGTEEACPASRLYYRRKSALKEDRYPLNIDTALVFYFCFLGGSCILFIPITLPR